MDPYILSLLEKSLLRCRATVQDLDNERDYRAFKAGYETGASMVINEIRMLSIHI